MRWRNVISILSVIVTVTAIITALFQKDLILENIKRIFSLEFENITPAIEHEILILVADFDKRSNISIYPQLYIYDELQRQIKNHNLKNIRVERLDCIVSANDFYLISEKFGSVLILWGWYDDLMINPYINFLKPLKMGECSHGYVEPISISTEEESKLKVILELCTKCNYLFYYSLALYHFANGRGDNNQALSFVNCALSISCTDLKIQTDEVYFLRSKIYNIKNEYDKALSDLNEAIKIQHSNAKYFSNRGLIYYLLENEDAISDCNKAIELDSTYSNSYATLGLILFRKGNYDRGLTFCNKAIELAKLDELNYLRRGYLYLKLGNYENAMVDFNEAIKIDSSFYIPKKKSATLAKRLILLIERNIKSKKTLPIQSFENSKEYNINYLYFSDLDFIKGLAQATINDFNISIEFPSDYTSYYNFRGLCYLMQSQFKNAISDFNNSIKLFPGDYYAHTYRGLSYLIQNQPEMAIADFNKAIEIFPKFATAYEYRGLIGLLEDYAKKVNEDFKNEREILSKFSNSRGLLVLPSLMEISTKKAINDFNKAIKFAPKHSFLNYSNCGRACYMEGNYEQAIIAYNKAITLNSKHSKAYNDRGRCFFKLKKYNSAISDFNKSISLDSLFVIAYYNRGISYHAIKDYKKALENYNTVIKFLESDRGKFFLKRRNYYNDDKADTIQRDETELNLETPCPYYCRGLIYQIFNQKQEAISDFLKSSRCETDSNRRNLTSKRLNELGYRRGHFRR